ncbi:MAG: aminotransferase class I/II-fold pyridoxal phosphate-dependent enzyme [Bacteroidetes bacterium]|nr:aminotransferase class I/II-fold pyridoxal phosphate-dependent enzyme [Bacteroidota bacterium]
MISKDLLSRRVLDAQYAVRGPIVIRAQDLEAQGRKIVYCNIGNPQALKQKPLSFVRQLLSLVEYPALLESPDTLRLYPEDIVARARYVLEKHPHGTGAYTQSAGIPFIRKAVADFIARRDGIQTDWNRVILTDGASKGAQAAIVALLKEKNDGVMIPIPQYPLYSASITLFGGRQIGYHLDEENGWQLDQDTLTEALERAVQGGTHPVAIAVINPGNPTGGVLTPENIRMVVGFAKKHNLSIIADEVYQENIYSDRLKFVSFAETMDELGESDITLFSLHSVSKGFLGECGHRGGYLEIRNVPDDVMAQFIKLQSISLCANVGGQLATYMMVAPPQPGDASYETYVAERDGVLSSLKRKSEILQEGIKRIEGMSLVPPIGAMYAFVELELPHDPGVQLDSMSPAERLEYDAKRDSAFCFALLEKTGICVVPGSGFGQKPGTLHFRTTFLPPQDEIEELVVELKKFHEKYVRELQEA